MREKKEEDLPKERSEKKLNNLRFLDGQLQQEVEYKYKTTGGYGGHYGDQIERTAVGYIWRDVPHVRSDPEYTKRESDSE